MSDILPSAKELGKHTCHVCGRTHPKEEQHCERCGTALHSRKTDPIQRCVALCIASIIVYIPANLWSIMTVDQLGVLEDTTIFGGIVTFWQTKVYSVSIIIFTASVLIPGLKLFSLFYLCAVARGRIKAEGKFATKMYAVTELIGRWSFIDVFVVAVLVGLIQINNLMSITAGPAIAAFALMVVLTMLAAHSFDPRVIWDEIRKQKSELKKTSE